MHYSVDGKDFLDTLEDREPMSEFYKKMSDGAMPTTSQVNVEEYIAYFERLFAQSDEVLHICLSSGITGTFNSAMIAKSELEEKYHDKKLVLIDSLNASCGYGILALRAAKMRDDGRTLAETAEYIERLKHKLESWFFSTDLTSYVRGGRLSQVSGWFGTVLKICPLLCIDEAGKLIPKEKCRGKAKAIAACFDKMISLAENGTDYDGECYIANSACYDDAKALSDMIEKSFPKLMGKVNIVDVGKIIGSHTGVGTTGLFFVGK